MKKLRIFLSICMFFCAIITSAQPIGSPVARYGQLKVSGRYLSNSNNDTIMLRGLSFGWSTWWPRFWNTSCVSWLATDWRVDVVRASMGIDQNPGYLNDQKNQTKLMKAVIDGAINSGVYVIIDWHCEAFYPDQANSFFKLMAQTYGNKPNIIYELINEPTTQTWAEVKAYAQPIIDTIRKYDPNNIIVVGCPQWDQDIEDVANSPITGYSNIMYTVHFYAASHGQWLRDDCTYAYNKGIPIFITECAGTNSSGGGASDYTEWNAWWNFCEAQKISWVHWCVVDDNGTSSAVLKTTASSTGGWTTSQISETGIYVRSKLHSYYPQYISSATTSDSTITVKLDTPVIMPTIPSGFKITLNGSMKDSITNATLSHSDSTVIILTLNKKMINTDNINLSYSTGNVKTSKALELVYFNNMLTDNLLYRSAPIVTSAETSVNGDSVIIAFNKKMNSPADYLNQFQIETNTLKNISINSIDLKNDDSTEFVCKLSSRIYFEDTLTLSYLGTGVRSNDTGLLKTFSNLTITNVSTGYPPELISAAIRLNGKNWNAIVLNFDRSLANVSSNQMNFFSVSLNGTNDTIISIIGYTDSIKLIMKKTINHGDIVQVSYSGGSVSSINKGLLTSITNYIVPNGVPLSVKAVDLKNVVTIYPNPVNEILNIKLSTTPSQIELYSIEGNCLFNINSNEPLLEINMTKFKSGIYFLKVISPDLNVIPIKIVKE